MIGSLLSSPMVGGRAKKSLGMPEQDGFKENQFPMCLHSKVVQNLAAAVGTVHSTIKSIIYCEYKLVWREDHQKSAVEGIRKHFKIRSLCTAWMCVFTVQSTALNS